MSRLPFAPSPSTLSRWTAGACAVAAVLTLSACKDPRDTPQLPAYIEADMTAVASPVAGILFKMGVKEGQAVKSGENLYVLESNRELAQLAEAELAMAAERAAYEEDDEMMDMDAETIDDSKKFIEEIEDTGFEGFNGFEDDEEDDDNFVDTDDDDD